MFIYSKILCLITLVVIFDKGWTLSCYECVGPSNGGCANAVLTDFIKEPCVKHKAMNKPIAPYFQLENAAYLSASCVQASVVVNNATTVGRICAFTPDGANYCDILKKIVKVNSCSTCGSNYCNSEPVP